MKEIQDIIKAYDKAKSRSKQTALATVVHVEGSSYRRPGARMLVTEDGELTGAISGGCLEGDALRKALLVMSQQQSMVVTYDTTDEDDAKLGVGLGCNGVIQILIEPIIGGNLNNPIELLRALLRQREAAVIVTLFSLQNKRIAHQGTGILLMENLIRTNPVLNKNLYDSLLADAYKALHSHTSSIKNFIDRIEYTAFVEVIEPLVSLIIVGAGNDAIPLVQFANILGWPVTVVDGRNNYATSNRFPTAQNVVVSKANNLLSNIIIDEHTAVVLMTHNYNYDLVSLQVLLNAGVRYIGSLGPKKKLQRMLDELHENGLKLNDEHLRNIYGPVGLDIGAETAEEIALSIIAEIKAAFSNKQGTSLRTRQTPIHIREAGEMLLQIKNL